MKGKEKDRVSEVKGRRVNRRALAWSAAGILLEVLFVADLVAEGADGE